MPNEQCSACRWWVFQERIVTQSGLKIGSCRAHAPVVGYSEDGRRHDQHPNTAENHVCGDFRQPAAQEATDA